MATDPTKIEEQRGLYGEPVGDLVRRVMEQVGLTQSAVASVLGLSPAMLSQLMSGHRVKIGNPQALARLQSLLALADEASSLTRDATTQRLDEIRQSRGTLTTTQMSTTATPDPATVVRTVLRAVASGRDLERAADALDDVVPELAEVIRAYGTGSAHDAQRHLASIAHLL